MCAFLSGNEIDIGDANELYCGGMRLDRARVHREHVRADADDSEANHCTYVRKTRMYCGKAISGSAISGCHFFSHSTETEPS